MVALVTIEGLTKRFPKQAEPALRSVSTQIRSGHIVGLVGPDGSTREDLTELTIEARSLLTAALAERGFEGVREGDAAVLMALRLDVTEETRALDPYFAQDQVERYETGHLSLAAFAPITYDDVWRARSEVKLRTTAQGLGTLRVRWKELDEERSWQLDDLVSAVVERLP